MNPELIANVLMAGTVLCGTLTIGWFLGKWDERQERSCEVDGLKTSLAITQGELAKANTRHAALLRDLESAGFSLEATRLANRRLAIKAAISSSPLEVRRVA